MAFGGDIEGLIGGGEKGREDRESEMIKLGKVWIIDEQKVQLLDLPLKLA